MKPLVTICIPTYNAASYIKETLSSIRKQTYSNIEIIIGDNASNDNTEQIVRAYIDAHKLGISYYKNDENLGYSGNCNKLINMANGEFVAIYHSDDVYNPNIVKEQVELLVGNEDLAGCFTRFNKIASNGVEQKNNF
ncbi:glycosyltransferase family 2 protein [Vibrio sp. SA48]